VTLSGIYCNAHGPGIDYSDYGSYDPGAPGSTGGASLLDGYNFLTCAKEVVIKFNNCSVEDVEIGLLNSKNQEFTLQAFRDSNPVDEETGIEIRYRGTTQLGYYGWKDMSSSPINEIKITPPLVKHGLACFGQSQL
jgi:hypothetical protein